jgi:hypothetical protein
LGIEKAAGHDGAAVSKTRQPPRQNIKMPGTLLKLDEHLNTTAGTKHPKQNCSA